MIPPKKIFSKRGLRVIAGLEEEKYRNDIPGLTASDIRQIWRSPAHYRQNKLYPPDPTPDMEFGRALHMAALQPHLFAERYAVMDDEAVCERIGGERPRATSRYRDWKAGFLLENGGREILDIDDYNAVLSIAQEILGHPAGARLAEEGSRAEAALRWRHPGTGTEMKCRMDWISADHETVIDLKTCEDARPQAFSRSIWNYQYHLQAAVYREGVQMTTGSCPSFIFIAAEKKPPHGVIAYELDQDTLLYAASEVEACIRTYERCLKEDSWPAYLREVRLISLPAWANVTEVA